jgi:transcription elongation factor Elf1
MMSEMPPTPFDLKPVFVDGIKVEARPTEWDRPFADSFANDADGVPAIPTKFMTTCPRCAQIIVFVPRDLFLGKDGSKENIACGSCEAGVARAVDQEAVTNKIMTSKSPFVDPIGEKLLDTSNLDLTAIQPFKVSE